MRRGVNVSPNGKTSLHMFLSTPIAGVIMLQEPKTPPQTLVNRYLRHRERYCIEKYLKMENGVKVNGIHTNVRSTIVNDENGRPRTPSLNSLSLTEYSTNPSPPTSTPKPNVRSVVPDDFRLPTGYPDVCHLNCFEN